MQVDSTRGVVLPFPRRTASSETCVADVLFVCEDRALGAAVTRLLAGDGYRVRAVTHSGHALLACRTGRVDVLVAPLASGDMPGKELALRVRRQHPGVRAVFMLGPGETAAGDAALARPFTREELVARLEAVRVTVSSAS
jgi:DNA-binding response OmpR family regulator